TLLIEAITYTFVLTNGTAGSADYTTTNVDVLVPAGATTGTVSVPTTVDAIDEVTEGFSIASGAASATGTIIDNNNAPTVATIAPASATEGTDAGVSALRLRQPFSSSHYLYFCIDYWNRWKCGLHDYKC
ncbi:hypothetical protein, partial [Halpernia sp. GG3]